MYFCIYLLYVFFSNLELCLSCSSRTAIDVFECRARSYYCLSLNKRFVVVVVGKKGYQNRTKLRKLTSTVVDCFNSLFIVTKLQWQMLIITQ